MKFNSEPAKVAFCDFETSSRCDISLGSRKYSQHPSTEVLTCCVKVDGRMHRMGPGLTNEDKQLLARIGEDHVIVAHNAAFDSAVWENTLGLPSAEWFDTLATCRAAGLPGGLDKACAALGVKGKAEYGRQLIDMCCILKGNKVRPVSRYPNGDVNHVYKLMLDYNEQDVNALEKVYERTKAFVERGVVEADAAINERGIPIDRALMEQLRDLFALNERNARSELSMLAEGVNPGSTKQMSAWLQSMGFNISKCNKNVLKTFLAQPEDFYVGEEDMDAPFDIVKEALMHRREVVRVGGGKVDTALSVLDDDNRIRDVIVYWGAHTGRWASRKLQIHNFPATYFGIDIEELSQEIRGLDVAEAAKRVQAACDAASEKLKRHIYFSDALSVLIRAAVAAPALSKADYAAVELRGVAYLANCKPMLETLADPKKSVYIDMGEHVFNRRLDKERDSELYTFVKALVLGSTYGMSGDKFEKMCKLRDVDTSGLKQAGFSVADTVKMFRKKYPEIPALWAKFGEAALSCAKGVESECGRCQFVRSGADMHIVLPSGRPIVYRNVRIEMLVPMYCKMYNMPEIPVPTVCFDNPRGYRGFLYGSKVCENVVQGMCRDFWAHAMVDLEQEKLPTVAHVHDEGMGEHDQLDRMLEVMSTAPSWAPGFPMLVEGDVGPVWSKHSKRKSKKAMNGRVL